VNRASELDALLRGEPWILDVLARARDLGLPDWYVGAGAIRDLVWDVRFGDGFDPGRIEDVDLVYFDPDDLSHETEVAIEARLGPGWDVKNQARVHLWYPERFGDEVEPLTSTVDGIATWPEHATCIGVRLEDDGSLTIAAPFGLDALLDGVWSVNPVRVSPIECERRLAKKDPAHRWPLLRVM
jgi:hypothetical protein